MAYYLFQWTYTSESTKALVGTPHDRSVELRKAVEAFGGTLHQFFFAFGEYDGVAIVEFDDAENCAACSFSLNATGLNAAFRTTVLLTVEQGWHAMRLAHDAETGYLPPAGYVSHG